MGVPSLFDGSNFREISKSSTLHTPSKFHAKEVHPKLIGSRVIAMALKLVLKSIVCSWLECSVRKITRISLHTVSPCPEIPIKQPGVDTCNNRDETCFTNQLTTPAKEWAWWKCKYGVWSIFSRAVCTCKTNQFINLGIKASLLGIMLTIETGRHQSGDWEQFLDSRFRFRCLGGHAY